MVAIMSACHKIVTRFLCLYFEGKVSYKSFWCSHAVNQPGWGVCASAAKQCKLGYMSRDTKTKL